MSKLFSNIFICLVLVLGVSGISFAGVITEPTIMKSLNEATDPVIIGSDGPSSFKFAITIDGDYDGVVKDVLPAEFDAGGICSAGTEGVCCTLDTDCDTTAICDTTCQGGDNDGNECDTDADCPVSGTCTLDGMASCGDVTISEKNKPGDKLRPDHVEWDVDACSGEQTLMICMNTDRNPGHAKRGIDYYEPTSCGPLVLNDGASLDGLITDPLVVSTCEGIDCTDADTDGWSVDCNDCNDGDPAINPDATEICTANGVDENCDELVDCADTETCNGQDCSVNGAANSAICVSPDCVEQDCTDSMDNDGDSDTDCDDTDCAADPACTG